MIRPDGRAADELRPVRISVGEQPYAEGSVLIETGNTRVLCSVTVDERVPQFLRGAGQGWITAEYAMLPRSTVTRTPRERNIGGRAQEIQRLIGRSLRAVVDMQKLGERTLTVDCDVILADAGTRTASITGAYVALYQALQTMVERRQIESVPFKAAVAAIGVGIVDDEVFLDLCYEEDFRAEVDFNVVMTDKGQYVEIQGTAEGEAFTRSMLDNVLAAAEKGVIQLFDFQKQAIEGL